MRTHPRLILSFKPSLSFILLGALLATLWLAGGASRADALGQVVVRSVAWLLLIAAFLFGDRPKLREAGPVALLLGAALLLALVQLIPLPPGVWQSLPGRTIFSDAATLSGQGQPWRPWSIVPGATLNAAASLIIPIVTLLFVTNLNENERSALPAMLLCLIVASMLIGLMQFAGVVFNNPLINDTVGLVSGTLANRNHFALLMALGCLLIPAWVFLEGRPPRWRAPVGLGLLLLFLLAIMASGSRAGLILGALAVGIGLVLARQGIRKALSRAPRWAFPALVATIVGTIALFVLISIASDRAVSISRALELDSAQDMRGRALPTVLNMIQTYFPLGSGLGGFDPVFRIHEPFDLLKATYFNHAHNDFLEIVLDAGLPGLILLLCALAWWAIASLRAWRAGPGSRHALPKLGSAILFLVLISSAFDYPARTPIIMAIGIVAALWLNGVNRRPGPALPQQDQHL